MLSLAPRKNHTFCCCRFDECNRHVYVSREASPAVELSLQANPKVSSTTPRQATIAPLPPALTHASLNAFALVALMLLLVMLGLVCVYLFYKKKQLKRRLKNMNALPSVRYSKTPHDDDDGEYDQMSRGLLTNGLLTTVHSGDNHGSGLGDSSTMINKNKNDIVNDYLNNRLPPNVTLQYDHNSTQFSKPINRKNLQKREIIRNFSNIKP